MHIHILGICGTFMGGIAVLARELGLTVSGCDANVYPPMSTQLADAGIELIEGFDPKQLEANPDLVVIGNAMSRGNPLVEAVLDRGMSYTSGPQFLADFILKDRWVLAVSGTHGKTTTSTMLASILDDLGMSPGFLIGGVPLGFESSARLGDSPFFVVEADEYDSAFFDKRSKFVHYRPQTLVINNLEFDHADIFDNIAAIQRQFHHMIRTVPSLGRIVLPAKVPIIDELIALGCWSELEYIHNQKGWCAQLIEDDGSAFEVFFEGEFVGIVRWSMTGNHSVSNGLAAIAAARHVGVRPADGCLALSKFAGVKRRMERVLSSKNLTIYDDFAHHPTAIETTLKGLRERVGPTRIVAVIEPRSNTMKAGVHNGYLESAAAVADHVFWFDPEDTSTLGNYVLDPRQKIVTVFPELLRQVRAECDRGGHIVIMSNGGFNGLVQTLVGDYKES